jgi:hypothetical protein
MVWRLSSEAFAVLMGCEAHPHNTSKIEKPQVEKCEIFKSFITFVTYIGSLAQWASLC